MQTFEGRTAVVTGGGGLLGRAMALAFARQGMNVVVADLRDDAAQASVDAVTGAGGEAIGVVTDVTSRPSMDALADAAYDTFGAVHLLCNNAGVAVLKPF